MPVNPRAIQYRGIVNLAELLKLMKSWFEDHGYEFYEETVKSKLASDGLRREYRWTADREVNEYIKFHVFIFMDIRTMLDVEVVRDGKKERLTQCRIRLEVEGFVVLDWQGKYKKHKMLKKLQEFMHEHVIKKEIIYIWGDQLDYRLMKFEKIVKEYLEFEARTSAYEHKWA